MLTCELSPHLLEHLNDAYILLSKILIGCLSLSGENCTLIDSYWKIIRQQLYTLPCPSNTLWFYNRVNTHTQGFIIKDELKKV